MVGGASSGKSSVALALAGGKGRKAFVATGQPLDGEMAERISRHRRSRGPEWETSEVPVDLASWFEKHGADYRVVVLDCLTLWLSNLRERGVSEKQVPSLVAALLAAIRGASARVLLVSNELGLGLVPLEAETRRFRDLAGQVNQLVAREADEVHVVLSGIPLRIK
ncbi:MAG: bifunctional adenosylcobinamide kinase/adenosylcobinamide-phosphate guanylyltransferase [Nitrospirota bacterium]